MGRWVVLPGTVRAPVTMRAPLLAAGLFTMVWPAWDILAYLRSDPLPASSSVPWLFLVTCFVVFGAVIGGYGFAVVRVGRTGLRYRNSLLAPVAEVPYEQIRAVHGELFGVLLELRDGRRHLLLAGARLTLPALLGLPAQADQLTEFVRRQVQGHW